MGKREAMAKGFAMPQPPKRTAVGGAEADRFVGETPAKTTRGKRREAGERLTVYVPPELAEAIRVRCARERRSLSEAGTTAFTMWIDSHESE